MNYDEWTDLYRPIQNPHTATSFDGSMFETYGPELAHVQAAVPRCVWTLTECEGREIIARGWHLVNRIGYFITARPFEGDCLDVPILTDEEHEELENDEDPGMDAE